MERFEIQITPETPGRPSLRNPFESPNDYHHLHESLVPSPSIFKVKPSKSSPTKFNWSIDEMSSLLPVHIDQEDIQRQNLYLSQTRLDHDIEEKRQNAIEQFFIKGGIVPSPWAAPAMRKTTPIQTCSMSPMSSMSPMITAEPEKLTVSCQTTLSLPVDFDLEKILGEYYYRCDEPCEAVQESLSSSSLRRKLFLDGQADLSSGSDTSVPPSPERGLSGLQRPPLEQELRSVDSDCNGGSEGEALSSFLSSPMCCGIGAQTLPTGQFSSSPIEKGRFRNYSMGSITSPAFPDRSSPAGFTSPTLSPIGPQSSCTPMGSGERKQLSFMTPDDVGTPLDMDVNSCTKSLYVDGCSPIRSCSPHPLHTNSHSQHSSRHRARTRCWASPHIISPILNPGLHNNLEKEEQLPPASLLSMELDPSSPSRRYGLPRTTMPPPGLERFSESVNSGPLEAVKMEELKGVEMEGRLEDIMEEEEKGAGASVLLTSSRMVNMSATESSLGEGSSIRYDSSMQVDSGYNTTSAGTTASLIDGFSLEFQSKESFTSNLGDEAFPFPKTTKVKVFYPPY